MDQYDLNRLHYLTQRIDNFGMEYLTDSEQCEYEILQNEYEKQKH